MTPLALEISNGTGTGDFPKRLSERVKAFAPRGFVVLDGSHFDDLPRLLRQNRLFARSLFLDHGDAEVERAGPWLVSLAQSERAPDIVFDLVGAKPAAVFWSSERGEAVLHRHLRTLNLARIPTWAATGGHAPPAEHSDERYETVTFRHWDPRVLGGLLPVLDAQQFARMLGPAEELTVWAADYGGLKRVEANPAWPASPAGLITIRSEQIVMLNDRRIQASRRRVMAFLRDTAPEHASNRTDDELYRDIVRYEASARSVGLTSERSFGKWAHLMAMSGEEIGRSDGPVLRYITTTSGRPDDKLDALVGQMIAEGRRIERGV